MMFDELYCFLIHHKELNVPGIGTFLLQRKPARIDFLNRSVQAPSHCISFQSFNQSPSKKLFSWLADAFSISDRDAVVRFNDFAFDIKKKIEEGNIIKWKGVGVLEKKGNQINFLPEENTFERPVPAEKIIREHAQHTMLVGEQERTSAEMEQWFHRTKKKRIFHWQIIALIIGALVIAFLVWYFFENGLDISSWGNQQKIR